MKYLLNFILILLVCTSCQQTTIGSGPVVTRNSKIKAFTKISSDVDADITITMQSGNPSAQIIAQQNIIDNIRIEQDGNELRLHTAHSYSTNEPVKILLTTSALDRIVSNGSGNILVNGQVHADNFKVSINGSGSAQAEIYTTNLEANIAGSGDINLSGSAVKSNLQITGSGNIDAVKLGSNDADVVLAGSGVVDVNALQNLKADLKGSGNIRYHGNPAVSSNVAGSGEIIHVK